MTQTLECFDAKQWVESSHDSTVPASTDSATTTLNVTYVTADTIGVRYKTMPGNQPNSFGNYVALWQNNNSIPWNTDPLKTQVIDTNTPSGDMVFHDLDVTNNSYIIGYSVSPELSGNKQKQGNICSTAFIPAIGSSPDKNNPYTLFDPSLQVAYVGTNSVAVQYNLPSGVLPQGNGAWIGIWRSEQASYNNPPMEANDIEVNASSGTAFINNISIGRGLTYTIGLFSSGWGGSASPNNQCPLACSVTFTNS